MELPSYGHAYYRNYVIENTSPYADYTSYMAQPTNLNRQVYDFDRLRAGTIIELVKKIDELLGGRDENERIWGEFI